MLFFEFLLPFTRETQLREALDGLFYLDEVIQRIEEIGAPTLATIVPPEAEEHEQAYRNRIAALINTHFGGYSIGVVDGRFRATDLKSYQEAAQTMAQRGRYLVDEKTAVARFLVRLPSTMKTLGDNVASVLEFFRQESGSDDNRAHSMMHHDDVFVIRSLFFLFFVERVIHMVDGEDQIWVTETGPHGQFLYVYEQQSP